LCLFTVSCSEYDSFEANDQLAGNPGNPRFNLQFTNSENVDLDLYVKTPHGSVIYYGNRSADDGQLDVDCQCGSCPQGGNENIYWETGTAPTGTFEYYVRYFGSCGSSGSSSNFTIRVLKNSEIIATRTGTLTSGQSTVWTHEQL
jgi:uncharacterized protein YfaP (DUF2135 family)